MTLHDTGVTDPLAPIARLTQAIAARLVGHERLVERLAIGVLAGGHLLIEGPPGLAKTRAVKALAAGLDADFARIQCTPDLMPSDMTGTQVFRPDDARFDFIPGPLFHNLVLVDEINRAPPKVQSALLEAMAERQITAGGVTRPLPDPFMVVATQNSIEHEGTFPLPEAQLDRFLLHVALDPPRRRGRARHPRAGRSRGPRAPRPPAAPASAPPPSMPRKRRPTASTSRPRSRTSSSASSSPPARPRARPSTASSSTPSRPAAPSPSPPPRGPAPRSAAATTRCPRTSRTSPPTPSRTAWSRAGAPPPTASPPRDIVARALAHVRPW